MASNAYQCDGFGGQTYDAANQVQGWSYDAAGNLLSDGTTSSTYDALGRAISTGGTANSYNADGILVQQGTTRYTQDVAAPLSQILGNGTSTYVYGAERLFAQGDGGARLWYATDALGSVRQTLNGSGAVLGNVAYDPWGQVQQGSVPTFGFTGELQQGANVYLRARWYTAGRGVFSSRDPFAGYPEQPYSLMPYQYVYSAPTTWTDASGLCVVQNGRITDIQRLDCTIQQFERFTAAERRNWVTTFSRTYGVEGWFNNVNDIISFFEESCTLRNLARGSWASWSDAGVLQVIQDGQSLSFNGRSTNPIVPAARRWQRFFDQFRLNKNNVRTLKSFWGPAEQAGVDYGIAEANKRVQPIGMEAVLIRNFVESGNIYRRITGVIGGGGDAGCKVARKLAHVLVFGQIPPYVPEPLEGLHDAVDDVSCRVGVEAGEWFTNPWSTVPGSSHGPTYFSAKFIEEATLRGVRPQDIFEEVLR